MTTPFDRWLTTDPRDTPECPACEGTGCAADTGSRPPLVCPACAGTGAAPHPRARAGRASLFLRAPSSPIRHGCFGCSALRPWLWPLAPTR